MKKPRRVDFEFHSTGEQSYIYWEHYAPELEKYISFFEQEKDHLRNVFEELLSATSGIRQSHDSYWHTKADLTERK